MKLQWPDPTPYPARLDALTSLRFFLAIGVVFFHFHLGWAYDDMQVTGLFERGRLGVDVFFILSGFILTHVYSQPASARPIGYLTFLSARIARVFPVHLLALFFVLAMVLAAEWLGQDYRSHQFTAAGFFQTLFLVQAWFPTDKLNEWNGPSWSLSAEWFVYLLFPAFAWVVFRLKDRPLVLLALAVALFVGLDISYQTIAGKILPHAEENLGILRIIPEFLGGMGLYHLGRRLSLSPLIARMCALVAVSAFLAALHFSFDDRIIVALAAPLILSLALLSKANVEGPLKAPGLLFLGEASYALYLMHIPLFTAWRGAVSAVTGVPSAYKMEIGEVLLLLLLAVGTSVLVFALFEKPARRLIRTWSARWDHPAAGDRA